MGKNDKELKRSAARHSQNLSDMFKKKRTENDQTNEDAQTVNQDTANIGDENSISSLPNSLITGIHDETHGKQSSGGSIPVAIEEPFQPTDPSFTFPLRTTKSGKSKRFNREWFNNENWSSWLHYDAEKDAAFCATCIAATRKNLISNKNADKAFISNGFVNWSDAGTKNRGFDKHYRSESHREAHERLITIPNVCGDISSQISAAHNHEKSVNRQNLLKILSNIRFLGRQSIPLRGKGSGEDSNFTQLYILREEDNDGLRAWRTEKKTDKYIHSTMQNEMIKLMALKILREIAGNIRDTDFFSMMCDEATDVSNTSQLVVCLRWVDEDLTAHDEFIGLKNMPSPDADSIVRELKDVLLRMHLNLQKCRGQCYDGCSTMSGAKNGVAVQIKNEESRALYTHCYSHSLNLAVGDTMKNCPILQDTIDNTYELTKLVKFSPKRDAKLDQIQKELAHANDDEDDEFDHLLKNPTIKLFCHTRWTVRGDCLRSVIANFDELQELWDWSFKNCSNAELKGRIRGIKVYTKTFSFIFGVHLAEMILAHTDNLNQTLQGTQMTAVDAQVLARGTVRTLESLRSQENFDCFWVKLNKFADDHKTDEPKLSRKKKTTIKCHFGKSIGDHPQTAEDDCRRKYFAVIDTVISCIKDRFEQEDYCMYATLEQLVLKAARSEKCEDELDTVISFFKGDFDAELLRVQIKTVPNIIGDGAESYETFHDVRKVVQTLRKPMKMLISEFVKVLKLIIVMPATNAVSERSFSAMRRLFTYLRTNMSKNRLNNLMVLHLHKERLDDISLIDIANDFVLGSEHRQTVFGSFDEFDLRKSTTPVRSIGTQVKMPE